MICGDHRICSNVYTTYKRLKSVKRCIVEVRMNSGVLDFVTVNLKNVAWSLVFELLSTPKGNSSAHETQMTQKTQQAEKPYPKSPGKSTCLQTKKKTCRLVTGAEG